MKFQKITPYLWFDNQAKEAADFYCSMFDNSKIISDGETIVEFELEGLSFIALNGGPQYQFNEAISFYVLCENQEEIDYLWNRLIADGGSEGRCSWCKDKFGVSWQIVPKRFIEMMKTGTPDQCKRVISEMMKMSKMTIEDFEKAFNHKAMITVKANIEASIEKVWECWTKPEHITQWNFASDEWCCPSATNELTPGGEFKWRMEAKDGSIGFDFIGIYEKVEEEKSLSYKMSDGRKVNINFEKKVIISY